MWVDGPDPQTPLIATDYVVQVEQRYRGVPGGTVVIRRMGGAIDGCAQSFDEPRLAVGDRAMFFLREKATTWQGTPLAGPVYEMLGGGQGRWNVNPDGSLSTDALHLLPPEVTAMPLSDVVAAIQTALAGTPPTEPEARFFLVPIDAAPIPSALPNSSPAATP